MGVNTYDLMVEGGTATELADVCIQTMRRTGIRSVLMRTFQDLGQEYNTPDCYIEPVEVAIAEVDRLRKSYDDGDMLSVWTGPDVTWATSKHGYEACGFVTKRRFARCHCHERTAGRADGHDRRCEGLG